MAGEQTFLSNENALWAGAPEAYRDQLSALT